MSTAFNSFKKDSPKLTDTLGQSVKIIRENFYTSNEVYGNDHFPFDEERSSFIGKHQKVTLANPLQTAPESLADQCIIFPKKGDYKEGGTTKQGTFPALKNELGEFFLTVAKSVGGSTQDVLSAIGGITLPNGLIINWGRFSVSRHGCSFAIPFKSECWSVCLTTFTNSNSPHHYAVRDIYKNQFTLANWPAQDSTTLFFIAIGR